MKVIDKKIGEKVYYKYRINLPVKLVQELKLYDKEIEVEIQNHNLVIKKKLY